MTTERRRGRAMQAIGVAAALSGMALWAGGLHGVGAQAAPRAAAPATAMKAVEWTLPAGIGSQPDLAAAPDGSLLLSWITGDAAQRTLWFARFANGRWSAPRAIARGDWMGNAMDTPHVRQTADGALWASWLRKSAASGHARDVVVARSSDGGRHWSKPALVHDDGTPTEHGFVSMWPVGRDRLGIAWLDGRAKAGAHDAHGAGGGTQMLRTAVFDAALARHGETALDRAVCDCCHTDVAVADGVPLIVYRDRTEDEVRDIRVARLQPGGRAASAEVHRDGWVMPACPVNGPAIAARNRHVVATWYTAAGGTSAIRMAVSRDGGMRFAPAMELDRDPAVLGRTDVAVGQASTWIGWLREDPRGQSLWFARIPHGARQAVERRPLVRLAGRGRGTGMPRIVAAGEGAYVVWSDVVDGELRLQGRRVTPG